MEKTKTTQIFRLHVIEPVFSTEETKIKNQNKLKANKTTNNISKT